MILNFSFPIRPRLLSSGKTDRHGHLQHGAVQGSNPGLHTWHMAGEARCQLSRTPTCKISPALTFSHGDQAKKMSQDSMFVLLAWLTYFLGISGEEEWRSTNLVLISHLQTVLLGFIYHSDSVCLHLCRKDVPGIKGLQRPS